MSLDVVRALNEDAGCRLTLVGTVDRGQPGAVYVRWPDGRDAVVTTAFATLGHMRQTADVLARARSLGIPVPAHEFLHDLDDGRVAVVQERLPGAPLTNVDAAAVDAVIGINERFAHLLADLPHIEPPPLSLGRPGDPIPSRDIERHSERARRLIDRIRFHGGHRSADVVGDDLVHVDLTVPNMLFDAEGRISGVVDWNYGVARGDRWFGAVKLYHDLCYDALAADPVTRPTREALARVKAVLTSELATGALLRYWAHQTLNMLYGSLRWGTPEAFRTYLRLGESLLL